MVECTKYTLRNGFDKKIDLESVGSFPSTFPEQAPGDLSDHKLKWASSRKKSDKDHGCIILSQGRS